MTRINVVPPEELSNKHLMAEYHELPRVVGLVKKAQAKGLMPDDIDAPEHYVLGKGHVKFFYSRLYFLHCRFEQLVREMKIRGYDPQFPRLPTYGLHYLWFADYIPTPEALAINRQRLKERSTASIGGVASKSRRAKRIR